MNDLTQLNVSITDHVATLTMNAPPVNALTRVPAPRTDAGDVAARARHRP